jgi:hypothetical protein
MEAQIMKRSSELQRKSPLKANSGIKRKPMKRKVRPKSSPIRQAAQGELCTVQIAGICRHTTETTVLAHLPFEGGIMGGKAPDLSGCFACDVCHDVIDGRRDWPGDEGQHRDWYLRRAMARTWRLLIDKGVIQVKGAKA